MQQIKDNYPSFKEFGYEVREQLGSNYTGGRFTYKAIDLKVNLPVVIKQFRFATANSGWDGYKALEREIQTLQKIAHPQIPKYITSFDSGDGLCLVMEYIDGVPLSSKTFESHEVYKIAIDLLEILTYTHNLNIIHRDIKPENILIDKENKIYLIDFGLASFTSGNQSMRVSSVVAGTIGMMPPEQLLNKKVTPKSDIYSLGVTIFCLLMKQNTGWISSIIDSSFRIRVREFLTVQVSTEFIGWLEQCVSSDIEYRFQTARKALSEIKKISIEKNTEQLNVRDRDKNELRANLRAGFFAFLTILPLIILTEKPFNEIFMTLTINSEGVAGQEIINQVANQILTGILPNVFLMLIVMLIMIGLINYIYNRY